MEPLLDRPPSAREAIAGQAGTLARRAASACSSLELRSVDDAERARVRTAHGYALTILRAADGEGTFDEPIRLLHEAVELDPTNVSAWRTLGLAESLAGHPEEATAAFRAALREDPDALRDHPLAERAFEAAREGEVIIAPRIR